jgi:hypothetical protein
VPRLGVHRVDSGKCEIAVLRGCRGRLGVHGVDSGKCGSGVLCGCCRALVRRVDTLAQPRRGHGEDGLLQVGAEAARRHDCVDGAQGDAVGRDGHTGKFRLKSVGRVSHIC